MIKNNNNWCCRVAPSLGELEATHQEIWGTKDYVYSEDKDKPTCFFGLYDLRDYIALWKHKGEKYILWAGSDLENLVNGFTFNDGKLKWLSKIFNGLPKFLMNMLRYNCIHYVEDKDEERKLASLGIRAKIVPSFLGKIDDFSVSYKQERRPNVYLSAHPDRENEYGFGLIEELAEELPHIRFHLYGAGWKSEKENIICHGLVSKEQFNKEIKNYQCGLRLNKSDGFSEITAKSVLMGQYPMTYLEYPMIPSFNNREELIELLSALSDMDRPNYQARNYYLIYLNRYPWNICQ